MSNYHVIYLEKTGSSRMVSKPGRFDRQTESRYWYSGARPSKLNPAGPLSFETSELNDAVPVGSAASGDIFPPVIRFGAELAAMRKTATSAAVTTELDLLIGNMT